MFMLDESYEFELPCKNLKNSTNVLTKTWKLNVLNTFNRMGLDHNLKGGSY